MNKQRNELLQQLYNLLQLFDAKILYKKTFEKLFGLQ